MVDQRLSLVTLGVADLGRAIRFYEALGWTRSSPAAQGVAFFQLGGIGLSLYPSSDLAADCGLSEQRMPAFRAVTLAHNVRTRDAVESVFETFVSAGARLIKRPHKTPWGGTIAYVADPDGHIWEIAWNPGFPLDQEGNLRIPD